MGDSLAESDRIFLDVAARHALRALGDVEPNPMVGAVLVRDGTVIGIGHHRRFGGPHAERDALADAARRGLDPRGSTLYCTLEPCTHHGKTPPCTDAILSAGIASVVIASRDPNPAASGGADLLRARGLNVRISGESDLATALAQAFIRRTTLGLPFVIAKWAQTPEGRIAAGPGDPRWISCERARRRVHRLRARIDAVVTGVGTVLADDPMLTARGVRVHRVASRVVLDSSLRTPHTSALVRSARSTPTLIAYNPAALAHSGDPGRLEAMRSAGVDLIAAPASTSGLDLHAVMRALASRGVSTILLEAGPTMLDSFIEARLVDRVLVHVGAGALPPNTGPAISSVERRLAKGEQWAHVRTKRIDDDLELLYSRSTQGGAAR